MASGNRDGAWQQQMARTYIRSTYRNIVCIHTCTNNIYKMNACKMFYLLSTFHTESPYIACCRWKQQNTPFWIEFFRFRPGLFISVKMEYGDNYRHPLVKPHPFHSARFGTGANDPGEWTSGNHTSKEHIFKHSLSSVQVCINIQQMMHGESLSNKAK